MEQRFSLCFDIGIFAKSDQIDKGGDHVERLADKSSDGKVEDVMYYPTGGGAGYLANSDMLGVCLPHKIAHNKQGYAWKRNKDHLLWGMVKIDRECKRGSICKLNYGKLPRLLRVLHIHKTANKVAKIEHRTAPRTYQEKIQKEHKAARALKQEEATVLFKLEGQDYDYKSDYSEALCDKLCC